MKHALLSLLVLTALLLTGCWSTPNDYWEGNEDTDTETIDAGECDEDDYEDDCMDAGI